MLQFEAGLRPRRLADFTGQSKLKENLVDRHRGRQNARRGDGPRAALRPARAWARPRSPPSSPRNWRSRSPPPPARCCRRSSTSPASSATSACTRSSSSTKSTACCPDVEEMLYSALEDFRVDILVGAGPGARTRVAADAEVHRDRRHHAAGPGQRAAARPLRAGAAPGPVHRRRAEEHRPPLGEAAGRRRSRTPPPRRSRAAAAGRRASPTACCAASATTRRCAPTAASRSRSRRPR